MFRPLAIALLFPTLLHAQQAQVLPQHDMKRWGIPAGNYSGIAHIEGDRYALVNDWAQADGWTEVSISFLPSGDISRVTFIASHYDQQTFGKARDSEGIVHVGNRHFFISAEDDQQIIEVDEHGKRTGRQLAVPEQFHTSNIYSNYGFEALAYSHSQGTFWTTTEHGLKSDITDISSNTNRIPTLLRIQSFDSDLQPLHQYAYKTDAPQVSQHSKYYAFGVPEMLSVNDTTLLVMERELSVPANYNHSICHIKLYRINPHTATPLEDTSTPLSKLSPQHFLHKKLVAEFSTGISLIGRKDYANYEGMCLGPVTADGRHTLILVSDSQNRAGNFLYHLKDYIRVVTF